MALIKAILLGVIQGMTEFLPVSSSGHLVIASRLLGFQEQGLVFDVMLHLGTLLAVVIVFRDDILKMLYAPFRWISGNRKRQVRHFLYLDIYIVIATLPAVIIGLGFKDRIEMMFSSTFVVCLMLIVTGLLMIITSFLKDRGKRLNSFRSLLIGCAQACAMAPGISRSGTTIFAGMLLGINRETAARFSFLMSIPAILGAAVLQLRDVFIQPLLPETLMYIGAGTVSAAVTGYFAIILLLDVVRKNRLPWFGYYCLAVAATGLAVILVTSGSV